MNASLLNLKIYQPRSYQAQPVHLYPVLSHEPLCLHTRHPNSLGNTRTCQPRSSRRRSTPSSCRTLPVHPFHTLMCCTKRRCSQFRICMYNPVVSDMQRRVEYTRITSERVAVCVSQPASSQTFWHSPCSLHVLPWCLGHSLMLQSAPVKPDSQTQSEPVYLYVCVLVCVCVCVCVCARARNISHK